MTKAKPDRSARGTQEAALIQNRLVGVPGVLAATGISRANLYRLLSKGDFPRPRRLSGRRIGFLAADVEQWIATRAVA